MSPDEPTSGISPVALALAFILCLSGLMIASGTAEAASNATPKACSSISSNGDNRLNLDPSEARIIFRTMCPPQTARAAVAPTGGSPRRSAPPETVVTATAPSTAPDTLAAHVPIVNPDLRAVFVSRDSISTLGEFAFHQTPEGTGIPISSPLGASVTGTIDELKKTQSVVVQGYIGICVICGALLTDNASFSVGPALLADGSLTNPMAAKSPVTPSALRTGPDLAVNFADLGKGEISLNLHTDVLPFYQTDFRGNARMSGVQLLAEPSSTNFHLGTDACGDPMDPTHCVFGYVVRLIPEGDIVNVSNPGQTFFAKPGTYDYLGGNAQITFSLFRGMSAEDAHLTPAVFQFLHSLSATVMYKYLANVGPGGGKIDNLMGEIDYQLGNTPGNPNGFAAISLSYQAGYDELTLQNQKVFKLALNYKY